jgi:hypothetical protein
VILWLLDTQCTLTSAVVHFATKYPALKDSSLRRWKTQFLDIRNVFEAQSYPPEEACLEAIAKYCQVKTKGCPLLLGDQHKTLLEILCSLRSAGGKINPSVVRGVAIGVMTEAGRAQELAVNGGPLELKRDWARKILSHHLQWTKRKATTDRKLSEEETKEAAIEQLKLEKDIRLYHPALVIEFDETLAAYCPVDSHTYALTGEKKVQVLARNDKRGETMTIAITRNNEVFPFQVIWTGLTGRSIPKANWPPGFLNCYAGNTSNRISESGKTKAKSNKWQNRKTISEFLN